MEKRTRIHEVGVTDIQSKDPIIALYHGKAKRCSHKLEVTLKARTSKDVMIDVIRDLIVDIIN